jgi:hypothetical protein
LAGSSAFAVSPDAVLGGLAGTVLIGGTTASNRLEQTYYLGTFDPDNRVPPTFFRVRVRGQASLLSKMKFGSGWVPAFLADSLNGQLPTDAQNLSEEDFKAGVTQRPFGARLQQYGPEGFRIVPDNARLAIVMGSDPEAFFRLVDSFTDSLLSKNLPSASSDQVFLKAKINSVITERQEWSDLQSENQPFFE